MIYSVLNYGLQQSMKLNEKEENIREAAVVRVKLIANAVQLVKEGDEERRALASMKAPLAYAPHVQGATSMWSGVRAAAAAGKLSPQQIALAAKVPALPHRPAN